MIKKSNIVFSGTTLLSNSVIIHDNNKSPLISILGWGSNTISFDRKSINKKTFRAFSDMYENYLFTNFAHLTHLFTFNFVCRDNTFLLSLNPERGRNDDPVLNYIDCLRIIKPHPVLLVGSDSYCDLDYKFTMKSEASNHPLSTNNKSRNFIPNFTYIIIHKDESHTDHFMTVEYFFNLNSPCTKPWFGEGKNPTPEEVWWDIAPLPDNWNLEPIFVKLDKCNFKLVNTINLSSAYRDTIGEVYDVWSYF